ncbi:MAG: hypothetical protein BWY68_00398 [bacterium ADurb.Bin400]|nr:MAG: hypothetical protein BWY68_00398 [bacterium ADurb.Bin400]
MAFLYHKFTRRLLITLVLFWSTFSFWSLNPLGFSRIIVAVLGVACLYFIWREMAAAFLLIFLSFTSAYALFGFFIQYNLPTWLVMLAVMVIFGFLFMYNEQKLGILGNKRLIYLVLFALIILEVFLMLTYFYINPINQSLIVATVSYLFSGFSLSILAKRSDIKLVSYVWIALAATLAILLSSNWSTP